MREIKFKGKSIETDEFVIGFIEMYGTLFSIMASVKKEGSKVKINHTPVYSETIGQYTGRRDKNGKEIYESDIVKFYDDIEDELIEGVVAWDEAECMFYVECKYDWIRLGSQWTFEVIGNIHDRKETEQ